MVSSASAAQDSDGEVVLLIQPPQGRNVRREELLHAKASDDTAIWLYFNKKSNKGTYDQIGFKLMINHCHTYLCLD